MACWTFIRPLQTKEERAAEIKAATRKLETLLLKGGASVVIGPDGAITFAGWSERSDVSDVCAYRSLTQQGSKALADAIAKAELKQGKKINPAAVKAGVHSHDGGRTWGRH